MSNINIYTKKDLVSLREAGNIHVEVQKELLKEIRIGQTPINLDNIAKDIISKRKARSAFYRFHSYPKNVCISINNEILHGIPNDREFQDGDVVKVDVGIKFNRMIVDGAFTVIVTSKENLEKTKASDTYKLVKLTYKALRNSIKELNTSNYVSDFSKVFADTLKPTKHNLIKEYMGHGVGRSLHEEPKIPNSPDVVQFTNWRIKNGMCLAIEPMTFNKEVNLTVGQDGWTVFAEEDNAIGVHFEETIFVMNDEFLSLNQNSNLNEDNLAVF